MMSIKKCVIKLAQKVEHVYINRNKKKITSEMVPICFII